MLLTREGIKPNPKKLNLIMDLIQPTTTIEAQALIDIGQYYREMWTRRSHVVPPPTEADSDPKGIKYCVMTI